MATKKTPDPADISATDQTGADASSLLDVSTGNAAAIATPAADAIPDPIFATGDDGVQRPMSGGSFIRLEDGTLTRNPEA